MRNRQLWVFRDSYGSDEGLCLTSSEYPVCAMCVRLFSVDYAEHGEVVFVHSSIKPKNIWKKKNA